MYSTRSFLKISADVYLPGYSNSDFIRPKKFSIIALSRQFPLRDMLWIMPCFFRLFWFDHGVGSQMSDSSKVYQFLWNNYNLSL